VLMSARPVLMRIVHESVHDCTISVAKVLMLHFSLHAEKLANINREKVNKEKDQN